MTKKTTTNTAPIPTPQVGTGTTLLDNNATAENLILLVIRAACFRQLVRHTDVCRHYLPYHPAPPNFWRNAAAVERYAAAKAEPEKVVS